jgi:hypothetical protein
MSNFIDGDFYKKGGWFREEIGPTGSVRIFTSKNYALGVRYKQQKTRRIVIC